MPLSSPILTARLTEIEKVQATLQGLVAGRRWQVGGPQLAGEAESRKANSESPKPNP
jgi:hypothetical protein